MTNPRPDADPGRAEPGSPLAIFDLDGTVTDTGHRQHFIERRPKRWAAFFAAAGEDSAHPEGLAAVRSAAASGWSIAYLSGRPERLRAVTLGWLEDHGCPAGQLLLREDRDRSSAVDFKSRALRQLARRHRLVLLVDDDPDVVAAARRLPVEHVMLADWQPRQISTPQER